MDGEEENVVGLPLATLLELYPELLAVPPIAAQSSAVQHDAIRLLARCEVRWQIWRASGEFARLRPGCAPMSAGRRTLPPIDGGAGPDLSAPALSIWASSAI